MKSSKEAVGVTSIDGESAVSPKEETIYDRDETFEEDARPSWPFASEDEEHKHFDDLQRVRDIRSA